MTFNILGFDQAMLINLMDEKQIKLNSNDLLVLRNMTDMINGNRLETKSFNGTTYTWIKYSLLVENLPIISDKEDTFKKIVTKLISIGLLERHVVKTVGHGSYTYFKTTSLLSTIEYTPKENKTSLSSKSAPNTANTNLIMETTNVSDPITDDNLIITPAKKILMVRTKYPNLNLSDDDISFISTTNNSDLMKAINIVKESQVYSFKYIKNAIAKITSNKTSFNSFSSRDYDFEVLERKLLGWSD